MESFLVHWGYAAVALFGLLEACCVPIPSAITFVFAGALAGERHLNIIGVIVVGTIAELIGSFIAYGVGRAGGRPFVHRFGRYLLITQSDVDRAERFIAGRGIWAIPLGRALPIVRTFVSIVAGFINVPPLLFGVLSLTGTAVWVITMSFIGYGVGTAWHSIAHGIVIAGYGVAVVVALAVAAFIVSRLREVRQERQRARRRSGLAGPNYRHHPHMGTRKCSPKQSLTWPTLRLRRECYRPNQPGLAELTLLEPDRIPFLLRAVARCSG